MSGRRNRSRAGPSSELWGKLEAIPLTKHRPRRQCQENTASVYAQSLIHRRGHDSRYVSKGHHCGYYIVRPGSKLERQLGLEGAPTIDTADPFRHGYGADALAFRFNRAGVLDAPPAYIVQALPNDFYTRRLSSFVVGRSTVHDVDALFGRADDMKRLSEGLITYYVVEVYNSFEDHSGRGRH